MSNQTTHKRIILISILMIISGLFISLYLIAQINPIITLLILTGLSGYTLSAIIDEIKYSKYPIGTQDPELNQLVEELSPQSFTPNIRIIPLDVINAYTHGLTKRTGTIYITSRLVEDCTDTEIQAIISHEIGHIDSRHRLFYFLILPPTKIITLIHKIITEIQKQHTILFVLLYPISIITHSLKIIINKPTEKMIQHTEYLADSWAMNNTSYRHVFLTLRKLHKENVGVFIETDNNTHPTLEERMKKLTEKSDE